MTEGELRGEVDKQPLISVLCEISYEFVLKCDCGFKGEKKPDDYDFSKYRWIGENFDRIIKKREPWYPRGEIFEGGKIRELLTNGYRCFYEFFTKRNLLALVILLEEIKNVERKDMKGAELLVFSSTVDYSTKVSRVVQGAGRESCVNC